MLTNLLTWQGVRALATCEVLADAQQIAIVAADPVRPPIKWQHQQHWLQTAIPATPIAGDMLYARSTWRQPWRDQLVASVQAPVVLVSTFYDPIIKPAAAAQMFRPGSPIQRWFGVQAMATHPQLTAMPVGVEGDIVPLLQQTERRTVRDIPLYLNFQIGHAYPHSPEIARQVLWQQFAGQSWVTADRWMAGGEAPYVAQLGRSQFVLSPPGFSYDCYRTYEAIAMGAIPIVRRQRPITDVCEVLPVLLVDDWAEVTQERLQREWETRQPKDTRTLTLTYWRDQILSAARAAALTSTAVEVGA